MYLTRRIRPSLAILTALTVGHPTDSFAQPAGESRRLMARPHTVSRWSVTEGLPGNVVRDIVQGEDGRLWLIASGVLVRFDGSRFTTATLDGPAASGTTATEFPVQIERGGGDTLWLATSTGRLLARSRGSWQAMATTQRAAVRHQAIEMRAAPGADPILRSVIPEPTLWRRGVPLTVPWLVRSEDLYLDGQLGIDTAGTPWAMDRSGRAARPVVGSAEAPTERTLPMATSRFVRRGDGRGFLGVQRAAGQLELIDLEGTVVRSIPDAPERVPRLLTRDGRLIVATRDGLEIHRPDGTAPERIPLGTAATARSGVTVNVIIEDRDGGLWVGTDILGLLHLRPSFTREFSDADVASNRRQIRSVVPGSDGSAIAVAYRALYRFRGDRATPIALPYAFGESGPTAAAEDGRGALWTAGNAGVGVGLVVVRSPNGITRQYRRPQLPIKFVEDRRRGAMLWLESDAWCRAPLVDSNVTPIPAQCVALGAWGARDLLLARDGTIWIAGEPGVRAERDPEDGASRTRVYADSTGYPLALARALYEDADGALWIGTYRNGLARLTRTSRGRDSLVRVTTRAGLAEDVVSTIVEDTRGLLWMGGNRGIHAVARADVEAWLAGRAPRVPAIRVDHRDGLTNAEGSGWQATRDAEGFLWFPTFGGAVRIDPFAEYPRSGLVYRAIIDGIRSDSVMFPVRDTVTLPRGLRRVTVDAGAVRLRAPEEIQVEYRLEGHTNGWMSAEGAHDVLLAGLRPGRWRFDVRAVAPLHANVNPDAEIASIVLDVPPMFRESVWYQVLLLIGVVILLLVGTTLRTRWLSRRAATLQQEVERQTHLVREERDRTASALVQATQAGAQLRDLLTAKSRVFASLSHELRTPMSLIVGPLHELERDADGQFPPLARGHLGAISVAVRRLQRLTSQFLDLADAQSGVLRVRMQRLELVPFVQQCIDQLVPLAAPRGVRITLSLPGGVPLEAEIDPDQLDKVVTNLVMNAIRHAPEHGEVRVHIDRVEIESTPHWTLTVSDDGPGIAPALRERIFEPFFQGPGQTEGMGLGLALSRDVVVLHKGRLAVLDTERGASFQATIPCSMSTRVEPARDQVPGVSASAVTAATTATESPRAGSRKTRVLIVEDDLPLRDFLAEQLGASHVVRTASRGDEALTVLREWPADAVVSDIAMPGMDGIALCRILKADPLTRNIPVILLTARGAREDQLEGLGAGADDYIVKPFDPAQLRLKVENLMQLRHDLEERFRRALPAWSSILLQTGAEALDRPSEQFLERLYGVLVAHIPDQGFDVDQLAKSLHMSRASLYRRVKELLSTTPVDLLQTMRLEHAALLLRSESDTIATIAHRTGFKWAPTFTVRFTAHFGMTPSAYRGLHQGTSTSEAP